MDRIDSSRSTRAARTARRALSPKRAFVACLATAIAVSSASVAAALITTTSGSQVTRLSSPPASVKLNALESATQVYVFDERQNTTLTSAVAIDAASPGTYSTFPNGNATVPAGTVVDTSMIHSDITSRHPTIHRTGSVTFSGDIVGVIASTNRLAASDSSLGAPGTKYAGTTQWRGLEGGETDAPGFTDKFTISADHRTLSFDIQTGVMDEIRVLTSHASTLSTTISDSPDPVRAGGNVTYTITVTNNGSSTAPNVQVQDLFPGATFVSATASGGCTGTVTVVCTVGSIAAGGFASATVVVTSPSTVPAGGTLTNTATSPPGQNPATAVTTVTAPLTTTISDAPDPVTTGNDVQYTLTVTNNDPGFTVANAHVVDTLPSGATFKSATDAFGSCSGSTTIDCVLGSLAPGQSKSVQLLVTTPALGAEQDSTVITDTAVATPGPNTQASEDTTVEKRVDGISKGFVSPGGSITIDGDNPATLTLPNTGSGAPVTITQDEGSFCDGPCSGPATSINDFTGYSDPNHPIQLVLTFNFPASPTSLTDAATAFGSTIYKNDDPENPNVGTVVPFCTTQGAGVAVPHPCVDAHTIAQPTTNSFVVTFTILYVSGDPHYARR